MRYAGTVQKGPLCWNINSVNNASGFYSGGSQFESWPRHHLLLPRILIIFLSPSRQMPVLYLEKSHDRFLLNDSDLSNVIILR